MNFSDLLGKPLFQSVRQIDRLPLTIYYTANYEPVTSAVNEESSV
jgi:hypothetical protein